MRRTILSIAVFSGLAPMAQGQDCGVAGPDAVTGLISTVANYAPVGSYEALGLGLTLCNRGNAGLVVNVNNAQHPVAIANLYKITLGPGPTRIEQIGMSWAFHEFAVLQTAVCCTCTPGTSSLLGPGCSSANSASIMSTQSQLGPRWQVNAASGVSVFPRANPPIADATMRRVRVPLSELESGAQIRYITEGMYLAPDDAAAGHAANGVSWREATATAIAGNWSFALTGSTVVASPAIEAWAARDAGVRVRIVDIPGDGRVVVASRATDLGNGQWHYEYALQNLTSHRAVGGVRIPVHAWSSVTSPGFHDVAYHGGDGIPADPANPNTTARDFDATDWTFARTAQAARWSTTPFTENDNANALRWGTLYNVRFVANAPPTTGTLALELFRPGTPGEALADGLDVPVPACVADYNQSGGTPDDADVAAFFTDWNDGAPRADVNFSGGTPDDADVSHFFDLWNEGC